MNRTTTPEQVETAGDLVLEPGKPFPEARQIFGKLTDTEFLIGLFRNHETLEGVHLYTENEYAEFRAFLQLSSGIAFLGLFAVPSVELSFERAP